MRIAFHVKAKTARANIHIEVPMTPQAQFQELGGFRLQINHGFPTWQESYKTC